MATASDPLCGRAARKGGEPNPVHDRGPCRRDGLARRVPTGRTHFIGPLLRPGKPPVIPSGRSWGLAGKGIHAMYRAWMVGHIAGVGGQRRGVMELIDLLLRCRSYRRFHEAEAVPMAVLEQLVGLARLTASAGNLQPLRYALVCDRAVNAAVFETLGVGGVPQGLVRSGRRRTPGGLHRPFRRRASQEDRGLGPRHRGPDHPARRGGEGAWRRHHRHGRQGEAGRDRHGPRGL